MKSALYTRSHSPSAQDVDGSGGGVYRHGQLLPIPGGLRTAQRSPPEKPRGVGRLRGGPGRHLGGVASTDRQGDKVRVCVCERVVFIKKVAQWQVVNVGIVLVVYSTSSNMNILTSNLLSCIPMWDFKTRLHLVPYFIMLPIWDFLVVHFDISNKHTFWC